MKRIGFILAVIVISTMVSNSLEAQQWTPEPGKNLIYVDPTDAKVGLGLTNPSEALEIGDSGNLLFSAGSTAPLVPGDLLFNTNAGTQVGKIWATGLDGGESSIPEGLFFESKVGASQMVLDENGFIGLGTDSPIGNIHVIQGTGHMESLFQNSQDWDNYLRFSNSARSWRVGLWQGGTFRIQDLHTISRDVLFIEQGTLSAANQDALRIDSEGLIGLGTSDPQQKLHVKLDNSSVHALIESGSAGGTVTTKYLNAESDWSVGMSGAEIFEIENNGNPIVSIMDGAPTNLMFVEDNGRIGFNNNSPQANYHFYDASSSNILLVESGGGGTSSMAKFKNASGEWTVGMNGGEVFQVKNGTTSVFAIENNAPGSSLHIEDSGEVGIGTTNPGYELDVVGTIRAEEIIVEVTGGPDYVFADDYPLMSLEDVETHIQANRHLPGVPSAAEMQNGVQMSAMQMKLLEKVEELTLYMIEMKKENQALKARVSELEGR